MNGKTTERRCQSLLLVMLSTGTATGCTPQTPRLCAPRQPDGWSAQPIAIVFRFAPDANLDPAVKTSVGDEG